LATTEESNYLIDRNDLFAKFKHFPFLGNIDEKFLNQILGLSKMCKYFANEVIAREEELDSYIYIIIIGQVRAILLTIDVSFIGSSVL